MPGCSASWSASSSSTGGCANRRSAASDRVCPQQTVPPGACAGWGAGPAGLGAGAVLARAGDWWSLTVSVLSRLFHWEPVPVGVLGPLDREWVLSWRGLRELAIGGL